MRSLTPLFLSLLGAATAAFATGTGSTNPTEPLESDVVLLTKDNFYDFMEEHDLVMVNFYSPSCSHCRKFAPNYEAAATELKEDKVSLVKVNCKADGEFCHELGVEYWPKLEIFRGPDSRESYPGDRQTVSIVSYMMDELMSSGEGEGFYYQASA